MAKTYFYLGIVTTLLLLGIYSLTIYEDKIVVELPSGIDKCGKLKLIISEDTSIKVKCGWRILFEGKEYVDYFRTYGVNEKTGEDEWWVNDYRKKTKIKLSVLDYSPTHFIIRKEIPYYKGRTGTDGTLVIDYLFERGKIKWSYNFTTNNGAKHRIRLKVIKNRVDDYGYVFIPDDNLYYDRVDNTFYYGNVKGNIFVDPTITVTPGLTGVDAGYKELLVNFTALSYWETNATIFFGQSTTGNVTYDECDDNVVNTTLWTSVFTYTTEDTDHINMSKVIPLVATRSAHIETKTPYGNFYNISNTNIVTANFQIYAYTTVYERNDFWTHNNQLQIHNGTHKVDIDTKSGVGSGGLGTHSYNFSFNKTGDNVRVWKDGTEMGSSPFDLSSLSGNVWQIRLNVSGHNDHSGVNGELRAHMYYMYLNSSIKDSEYITKSELYNLTDYVSNFTATINNNGGGTSTYEFSMDNVSWSSFTSGQNTLTNSSNKTFYWRATTTNDHIIYSVNFTFDKYIWVEAVNVTPLNPYINDTLICNYTFFNSTNGTGNDNSVTNWYVNGGVVDTNISCVQEFANVTPTCGGFSNGSYDDGGGTWAADQGPDKAWDGDYDTYAFYGLGGNYGYLFVNYSKPIGATNDSTIEVKFGNEHENVSIPNDCWDYYSNILRFRLYAYRGGAGGAAAIYCWNSSWKQLFSDGGACALPCGYVYDERMFWSLNTSTLDNTYFDQSDEIYCNVTPFDGSAYGSSIMSNNVTINFTEAVNLTIEGKNITQTFELFTTTNVSCRIYDSIDNATLTSEKVCLGIDLQGFGNEFICENDGVIDYNFTIPFVQFDEWNDSSTSYNVTDNSSFSFFVQNWWEIRNVTFSAYSYNSTNDTKIDFLSNGSNEIDFRGEFVGFYLNETRFEDNSTSKEFDLLSVNTVSHNILLSTANPMNSNITLYVNASKANPSELDFLQVWNHTSNFSSYTGTAPVVTFDDLYTEVSGRWNKDTSGGGTAEYESEENRIKSFSSASCSQSTIGISDDSAYSWINSKSLSINTTKHLIDIDYNITLSASSSDGYSGAAGAVTRFYFYLTNSADGTSRPVTLESGYCNDGGGFTWCGANTGTFRLIRYSVNTWHYYKDGVFQTAFSMPSGDVNVELYTYGIASCNVWGSPGYGSAGATSDAQILALSYGGFGINYSTGNYSSGNYTLESEILLNSSPENTSSVYVDFDVIDDSGCSAEFFVSATNGTNWEEVVSPGNVYSFINLGEYVRYKVNLTQTSNSTLPCILTNVELDVDTNYPQNLSFYFGSSLLNSSYNIPGEVNDTNTPILVSMLATELNNYMASNCVGATCSVPLVIADANNATSSGLITIYDILFSMNTTDITYDGSLTNYLSSCSENCQVNNTVNDSDGGIIRLSDLKINYYGNGSINLNCTGGTASDEMSLNVLYSPFNVTIIPQSIDYWDVGPNIYSWEQTNIPPFGNANGDGNPFFNVSRVSSGSHAFDVFLRYNESINTCGNVTFEGFNTTSNTSLNITVNTAQQNLIYNISGQNNVSTWTNISCSASNSTLIIPYFCFFSFCQGCVETVDWNSTCDTTQ